MARAKVKEQELHSHPHPHPHPHHTNGSARKGVHTRLDETEKLSSSEVLFEPVPSVVEMAERFLEDARAGRVMAAAIALVGPDRRTASVSAARKGDVEVVHVLNSAISTLFCSFNSAVVEAASKRNAN